MNRSGSESVRVHWEQVSDIVAFWLCCVISTVIQKIQQPVMFSDFFLMPLCDVSKNALKRFYDCSNKIFKDRKMGEFAHAK